MKTNPYLRYYQLQSMRGRGELPVFVGRRWQRGHGIGGMFMKFFRTAAPFLKSAGSYIGKKLLRTGSRIMDDVAQGEKLKTAVKRRFQQSGKDVLRDVPSGIKKLRPHLPEFIREGIEEEERDIFNNGANR